ncbi:phage recombination protein Bet [Aureimonas glaciei]|uniref:Phage recombination protein Bet n=1 Tax=Aureimonas glaciei TaxID=1776957 RepID=A0A917D940_9HYPH|nr:phage recombination protein Bet [Aureimonas glaciei]GGD11826.1 phage recombination protein Bet [Aureimonas glaciei]
MSLTNYEMTSRQISLVKNTVAKDCDNSEFDLFMEAAKSYGLDPFRKQIIPLVFSKADANKRRMSIVVSRDGLRVIAQRCKNYRPASEPAEIQYDETLKGPTNPKGIVCARVKLWQQDNRGDWFPVVGEAYWDEFAPVKNEAEDYDWVDTGETWPDTGKPKKKKVARGVVAPKLDDSGNWARMPIVMITKCAEAQALRAGWPDQFSGVYVEEEMDRAKTLDLTASEIVAHEAEERRLLAIGASNSLTVTWGDNWALENVPIGEFADRAIEFLRDTTPDKAARWADANRVGLQQFWAKAPADALELKKVIERARTPKVAA